MQESEFFNLWVADDAYKQISRAKKSALEHEMIFALDGCLGGGWWKINNLYLTQNFVIYQFFLFLFLNPPIAVAASLSIIMYSFSARTEHDIILFIQY